MALNLWLYNIVNYKTSLLDKKKEQSHHLRETAPFFKFHLFAKREFTQVCIASLSLQPIFLGRVSLK